MEFELHKFEIKGFDSDAGVVFEIETSDKIIKYSAVLNTNHKEDVDMLLALEKFIIAKVGEKHA